MSLSETDKKILQRLQTNLPLTHRPFLDLADELDLDEDLVIERIKAMVEGKYVRRLAPIINTQAVGNSATLAAMQVPDDRIDDVAEVINGYSGVSHNYLRKGKNKELPLNIWFTMSASSQEKLEENLKAKNKTGESVSVHSLWHRRQSTKFNGVSYPIQRGAEAVYSEKGRAETGAL